MLFFSKNKKLLRFQGSGPSLLVELKLKGKFGFLGYLLENIFFHIDFLCDLVAIMSLVNFGKFQPWGSQLLEKKN
jgi:hypothetical protein